MKIRPISNAGYTILDTSSGSFLKIKIPFNLLGLKHLRGKQKPTFPFCVSLKLGDANPRQVILTSALPNI